jgi:hypothetical protein
LFEINKKTPHKITTRTMAVKLTGLFNKIPYDPETDKFIYLITGHQKAVSTDDDDMDFFYEIFNSSDRQKLFERVFQTEGYQLEIKNSNYILKGSIIGPVDQGSVNVFLSTVPHMQDFVHFCFKSRQDLYKITAGLGPEVLVSIKTEKVKRLKITEHHSQGPARAEPSHSQVLIKD